MFHNLWTIDEGREESEKKIIKKGRVGSLGWVMSLEAKVDPLLSKGYTVGSSGESSVAKATYRDVIEAVEFWRASKEVSCRACSRLSDLCC